MEVNQLKSEVSQIKTQIKNLEKGKQAVSDSKPDLTPQEQNFLDYYQFNHSELVC